MVTPRPLGVLITRPAGKGEALAERIRALGGEAWLLPCIEILPTPQPQRLRREIDTASPADWHLFISANAVQHALPLLPDDWPGEGRIAAVGKATATALEAAGYPVHLLPQGRADSEALLATPQFERVAGQTIAIYRGKGGRELLADTLAQRGARLRYHEVYSRQLPEFAAERLNLPWSRITHVIATSNEILENLLRLVGEFHNREDFSGWLLVVSERGRELAQRKGFRRLLLARGAGDQDLLNCISESLALEPEK